MHREPLENATDFMDTASLTIDREDQLVGINNHYPQHSSAHAHYL